MNTLAVPVSTHRGKPQRRARLFALCLALTASFTPTAFGATGTLSGNAADAQANRLAGVNSVAGLISTHCRIGNNSADDQQTSVVHVFEIPPAILADTTQWFDAASYTARLSGKLASTRNADLYGLGYRATSTVLASDFYAGAADTSANATLLKNNFLVPGTTSPSLVVESGVALTDYLNAQLSVARAANATSAFVFFRTSIDAIGNYQYYQLGMTEGGSANIPTLSYSTTIIPEWVPVALGGGGCVNGLVSNATGTDIYCRTDVGTAFRWVPASDGLNGRWLSITDTIVPTTTTGASGLACTASIAVDPNDSNKLYVAAGSNFAPLKGIYASTNRGANWTAINTSLAINGNGKYNGTGERLQVDPNNSNILWYGSTDSGLQKGVKSGGTWSWSQIPATSVPFGNNNVTADKGRAGVTFVACDPNSGSTIVYAGVHDSIGSTGGIYRSTDGGTTWVKVGGATVATPNRGQVARNGMLYVTAVGSVTKMPRGGSLTAVTPLASIHYRGLAVDPNDLTGNTVYVAHLSPTNSYNRIWRSTDGGANWAVQTNNMNDNRTIARSEPDGTPAITGYWLGAISSLLITPGNANELWAGDYFGVARTRNAQNLGGPAGTPTGLPQATWYMLQHNQDETCVEALKNAPTGPQLMVGMADVGGYRYNDVSQRPYGTYGSIFTNPGGANVNSVDFCESNHSIWARTWTGNKSIVQDGVDRFGGGGYSRDGGNTWLAFGEIVKKTISSSATPGWETLDLTTFLKAQKARGTASVTVVIGSFRALNSLGNVSGQSLSFASRNYTADLTKKPYLLVNGSSSFEPTADSTVEGLNPALNKGGDPQLATSWSWGEANGERHIYLRFDLSSMPSITTATLNLYRLASTSGVTHPVTAFAAPDGWVESTITWNTRPRPYASDADQLFSADPSFRTPAGAYLTGGRLAVSSTDANRLVWTPFRKEAAPFDEPHYSDDAGVTWYPCTGLPAGIMRLKSKSNPGYSIQQLASDRADTTGSFYMMEPGAAPNGDKKIYKSTNGGVSWSYISTIPKASAGANIYRVQIVAAPAAGHVWVCDDGVDNPAEGGLWKSTNGATSWSSRLTDIRGVLQVSFGKPKPNTPYLYSVFIHGYYQGVKGIYRSDDEGATWNALPALPSIISIESLGGDRQVYGSVFIGTGGRGIFHYQP